MSKIRPFDLHAVRALDPGAMTSDLRRLTRSSMIRNGSAIERFRRPARPGSQRQTTFGDAGLEIGSPDCLSPFKAAIEDKLMMKQTLWREIHLQRPLSIAVPAMIVAALIGPPAWSQPFYQDFNEVLLRPGQSQRIDVRSANPELRVCNDRESTARVAVAIGSNPTQLIGPGLCTEDLGETIDLRNGDEGSAVVTYRPINNSAGGS